MHVSCSKSEQYEKPCPVTDIVGRGARTTMVWQKDGLFVEKYMMLAFGSFEKRGRKKLIGWWWPVLDFVPKRDRILCTHRTDHDTFGFLFVISIHYPCMTHGSLSSVPSFAPYSASGRRARGIAQQLHLNFSDPRWCPPFFLGPTGCDKSSF